MLKKMELCHCGVHGSFPSTRARNKAYWRLTFKMSFWQKRLSTLFFGCLEIRPTGGACVFLPPGTVGLCPFPLVGEVGGVSCECCRFWLPFLHFFLLGWKCSLLIMDY